MLHHFFEANRDLFLSRFSSIELPFSDFLPETKTRRNQDALGSQDWVFYTILHGLGRLAGRAWSGGVLGRYFGLPSMGAGSRLREIGVADRLLKGGPNRLAPRVLKC